MNKLIKNKKGGERILFLYWFIMILMVGVAVVIGVSMFYSANFDVREIEAKLLGNKIIECLFDKGEVGEWFLSIAKKLQENFPAKCELNLEDKTPVYEDKAQYYIGIKQYDYNSCNSGNCGEGEKKIAIGDEDVTVLCELQEKNGKKRNLPQCSRTRVYALNKGKKLVFEILTAVKKTEQNA